MRLKLKKCRWVVGIFVHFEHLSAGDAHLQATGGIGAVFDIFGRLTHLS